MNLAESDQPRDGVSQTIPEHPLHKTKSWYVLVDRDRASYLWQDGEIHFGCDVEREAGFWATREEAEEAYMLYLLKQGANP